jgi:D-sedoheptulose 7-phosphate isomerase
VDNTIATDLVSNQLREALATHEALLSSEIIPDQLVKWGRICADSLAAGGAVFFAGNGGSFADAQHLAAELTGKMSRMRPPLAGIALGTNSSSMSAIGNDFGYEYTFARELEGLARPQSVVVAITTSGNSRNILDLATQAKTMDLSFLGMTGSGGGELAQICETIQVPSNRTERIQEMQILLGHTLCLLIEEFLGIFETQPQD